MLFFQQAESETGLPAPTARNVFNTTPAGNTCATPGATYSLRVSWNALLLLTTDGSSIAQPKSTVLHCSDLTLTCQYVEFK